MKKAFFRFPELQRRKIGKRKILSLRYLYLREKNPVFAIVLKLRKIKVKLCSYYY